MGAVYRANDENVGVPVAVKENLFLSGEYTRQFQQEARILAGLRHEGLPHVTDYFLIEGQGQYLVMDYIEGEDLRQRMERSGPIKEKEAILIGISILDALHHLHTRQPPVIHRDIKPGNIKISPQGQAVLVDFGLAKVLENNQATITGARAMTPGYSPPEQYGTSRTDERSDVYSLGATLFACLTGTIPEDGLVRLAGDHETESIRDLLPSLNKKLAEIIDRAMQVDPQNRFQTAMEFRRALIDCGEMSAYFTERPTVAPPPLDSPDRPPAVEQQAERVDPMLSFAARSSVRNKRKRRQDFARFGIGFFAGLAVIAAVLALVYQNGFLFPAEPVRSSPANMPAQETQVQAVNTLPPDDHAEITDTPTVSIDDSPTPETTSELIVIPEYTASPTPVGGTGQIAFASQRSGAIQVWLIDLRTRQMRQITNMRDGACQPSWSPDGTRLAFTSPCTAKREQYPGSSIYTIGVNGDNLSPLTQNPEGDYDPAWSPDGKMIAFTSLRKGIPTIYTIDLETQTATALTSTRNASFQPAWSSASRQIAYIRKSVYNQVWIMSDDGSRQTGFSVSGAVNNYTPTWGYAGETIYFTQAASENGMPILVGMRYEDRGTSIEFRIPAGRTVNIGPIASAVMSPDGFWFAYEGWPDGQNHDIYIMTANGASVTRLTTDAGFDFSPAWRPVSAP